MPNKIIYTHDQMAGDLQEIIRQMHLDNYRPDYVVGIARGGLVPATMLSHYFAKPLMALNYSLRDKMVCPDDEVNAMVEKLKEGFSLLMVDDICDSGETLRKIVDEVTPHMDSIVLGQYKGWESRLRTAVLWNNTSQDTFEAEYVGREVDRNEDERWVIFPFEEWWKV